MQSSDILSLKCEQCDKVFHTSYKIVRDKGIEVKLPASNFCSELCEIKHGCEYMKNEGG